MKIALPSEMLKVEGKLLAELIFAQQYKTNLTEKYVGFDRT